MFSSERKIDIHIRIDNEMFDTLNEDLINSISQVKNKNIIKKERRQH